MKYLELKDRHMKDIDDFPMFFAFNKEQFAEGLEKLGATQGEVCSIPHGGIIRKTDAKAFCDMILRHSKETEEALKDDLFLIEAMAYELANHEYCITYDAEPALMAIGIAKDDVDERVLRCLNVAIRQGEAYEA